MAARPSPGQSAPPPIRSTLAGDPAFAAILGEFVAGLPGRAGKLERLMDEGSLEQIRRMAHSLKGACGGYGFHELGAAAANIEACLVGQLARSEVDEEALERIRADVGALIALIRRVSARPGAKTPP